MGFTYLTEKQAEQITEDFHKRMKAKNAEMRHTRENFDLLRSHLKNKDRAIDAESLVAAASELRGSIDWITPLRPKPIKEFQDEGRTGRPNHADERDEAAFDDPLGIKSLRRAALAEAELQHEKKNQAALNRCEGLIRNFQRTPHSRTYQGRDRLAAELTRLKSRSADGVAIEKALLAFEKTIG